MENGKVRGFFRGSFESKKSYDLIQAPEKNAVLSRVWAFVLGCKGASFGYWYWAVKLMMLDLEGMADPPWN